MFIPKGNFRAHYLPYPFFLAYATSLLKRDLDVEVYAIDACALEFNEKEFVEYVGRIKPDILVTEIPTISFPLMIKVLREVKETLGCMIAVSGAHITALTFETMSKSPHIDFALLGEYEITLRDLVRILSIDGFNYKALRRVRGLAFRKDNSIIINPRREVLHNLDSLPFPDRDYFKVVMYHDFEIAGRPCVQMLSSRGCPFSCTFCVQRHVFYASPLYRKRNPKRVVDEMEICKEKYNAKQIYFDDETATVDKYHIREICKEILSRKLNIPWGCMGDVTLDKGTLKLMAKSGCVGIKFGVETINLKSLKSVQKYFVNVNRVQKFVRWCKELNMWTHATYVIGLPNDTYEGFLKTLKFALKLDTDSAQFSIAIPFPGTPFYKLCEENGWLVTKDWTLYDGNNFSVISYPWLSKDEIESLFRFARKVWKKNALRRYLFSPKRAIRYIKGRGVMYSITRLLEVLELL